MKKRVGLIGLGLMGAPMGHNWLRNGFELTVLPHVNRNPAEDLRARGAHIAESLQELAARSDVIILMVPTSREVEALLLGPKSLEKHLGPQHLAVDMSTSDPQSTVKIHKIYRKRNLRFFDAPVTGGVKGAENGTLTLFVGGPDSWFQETLEVFQAVSSRQSHFGKAGQGHVAKIINNFLCVGNLAVFSEALPLAIKWGLDPKLIYETLLSGTASSEMLKFYGPQILQGDFAPRFRMSHAEKDLRLVKNLGNPLSVKLPVLNGLLAFFQLAKRQGLFHENISALIKVFEKGLKVKFRSNSKEMSNNQPMDQISK